MTLLLMFSTIFGKSYSLVFFFRIRTFQMESSSLNFLVLWSHGWSIGVLSRRGKLVSLLLYFLDGSGYRNSEIG